jgi:exopolyphosphatase / guanosine-5'-triphosphate,3'-diphosphate pyrophosphatase
VDVVIPRWEWRTFGAELGAADAEFGAVEPESVQESDEVYLLSPATEAAVKIRAGLMDIKQLEHVDEAGLEQWRPAMKESFPLPPGEAVKVCAELGVPAPAQGAEAFSLEEFLAVLAAPVRGVHAVAVHKFRRHFTFKKCMVEMTAVTAAGQETRTLAIETTDAGRVLAAVTELGLSDRRNTSYPRWLKATVGMKD